MILMLQYISMYVYDKYRNESRPKRIFAVSMGALLAVSISPILTGLILFGAIYVLPYYVLYIPVKLAISFHNIIRDTAAVNESSTNSGFSPTEFIELKQQQSSLMEEADRTSSQDKIKISTDFNR